MICNRCDWPMQEEEKAYHHWCWGCGNWKDHAPTYHIPNRATCFSCGAEMKFNAVENTRARCKSCREKHRNKMREHRKRAGTKIANAEP